METGVCMNMVQGEGVLFHSEKCFLSLTDITKRSDERTVDADGELGRPV